MNHFSVIGYGTPTREMIQEFLNKYKSNARSLNFGSIKQRAYSDEQGGSELFFYFKNTRNFFGSISEEMFCFNPSYRGITKQNIKDVVLESNEKCPACARLDLWVHNESDHEYPLLVDLPNYPEIKSKDWKSLNTINITLFAHQIEYWNSQEEFDAESKKDKDKFNLGSQTFIPSGTFSINDDPNFKKTATCFCGGIVKFIEMKTNKFTGNHFYHLVINTYAASYDVVVEEKAFNTKPMLNSIIMGTFWVCGRINSI